MADNLTRKILSEHLASGRLEPGREIGLRMDQALLQDATGTLAMLEFEQLGLDRVAVDLAALYVDHNLLQTDHRNADDHAFLRHACARYGIHFSPPGNGVSHQVHMQHFGRPGLTLIGADSHTPGAGALGMLAIGAGGLDVTLALAGRPYYLPCPRVLGVRLEGELPDWVSAKDVVLEMLRRHGVKGCVGQVIEYHGPGVATLSATDRETICNMGTELGATSSLFPSDERTRAYLRAQGREQHWRALAADPGAGYDETECIDLSRVEPLIALPGSPGNVEPVRTVAGRGVDQVIVGSSVNSSFRDLMTVTEIVKGRRAASRTAFHINPGSRQVLANIDARGGVIDLLSAGANIHQSGCLGCIGMGQAPGSGQVSLRTFPRNFPGRSGTANDQVYLCSPETAAAAALRGIITDPRDLAPEIPYPRVDEPDEYLLEDDAILRPGAAPLVSDFQRGPRIIPLPDFDPLPDELTGEVLLRVGDDLSTDSIMPTGNQVVPLRSDIEAISDFLFYHEDPGFAERCRERGGGIVVGGENYGQGSSREHAALAPRYLGVRAKLAKSFARIHKANLCNFGVLPLEFDRPEDYDRFARGTRVELPALRRHVEDGRDDIPVRVDRETITARLRVSPRQRQHLLAGGALNTVREEMEQ